MNVRALRLCRSLQKATHQTTIAQQLHGSAATLGRYWFEPDAVNNPATLDIEKKPSVTQTLSNSNVRSFRCCFISF